MRCAPSTRGSASSWHHEQNLRYTLGAIGQLPGFMRLDATAVQWSQHGRPGGVSLGDRNLDLAFETDVELLDVRSTGSGSAAGIDLRQADPERVRWPCLHSLEAT